MSQATVGKWGHNLAIRVPLEIARSSGLSDGERVEIETLDGDILIRRPAARARRRSQAKAAAAERYVATFEVLLSDLKSDRKDEIIGSSLLNSMISILQHGYRVMDITDTRNMAHMCFKIHEVLNITIAEDTAQTIISRFTLTTDKQLQISLWSGGPQHLLIPVKDSHKAVILQGIPQLLSTLFYRTAHEQTERGTVFEEAFRQALGGLGLAVRNMENENL